MRNEYFLPITIFLLAFSLLFGIAALVKKYFPWLMILFIKNCRQISYPLFASEVNFISLLIGSLVLLMLLILISKTSFSLLKIIKRKKYLAKHQIEHLPLKLNLILADINISPEIITVYRSRTPQAFCSGFINPRLAISTSLIEKLSPKQLESVIFHELYHLKFHHGLILFVAEIISTIFFFFPLLKDLVTKMHLEFEIKADRATIIKQKTNKHLKLALAKVIGTKPTASWYPAFSQMALEERINQILGKSRRKENISSVKLIASTAVLLIGIGLFLIPIHHHTQAEEISYSAFSHCHTNQCSVNCLSQN